MQKIQDQIEENNRINAQNSLSLSSSAATTQPQVSQSRPSFKWIEPTSLAGEKSKKPKSTEWKNPSPKNNMTISSSSDAGRIIRKNHSSSSWKDRVAPSASTRLETSRNSSLASSNRSLKSKPTSPLPFIAGKSATKSHSNIVQKQQSAYLKKITNPSTLSLRPPSSGSGRSSSMETSGNRDEKIINLENELAMLNEQYRETMDLYNSQRFRPGSEEKRELERKLKGILKGMEIKGKQLLAVTSLISKRV